MKPQVRNLKRKILISHLFITANNLRKWKRVDIVTLLDWADKWTQWKSRRICSSVTKCFRALPGKARRWGHVRGVRQALGFVQLNGTNQIAEENDEDTDAVIESGITVLPVVKNFVEFVNF